MSCLDERSVKMFLEIASSSRVSIAFKALRSYLEEVFNSNSLGIGEKMKILSRAREDFLTEFDRAIDAVRERGIEDAGFYNGAE